MGGASLISACGFVERSGAQVRFDAAAKQANRLLEDRR